MIKTTKEREKAIGVRRRVSLKWKWTIGASMAIFFTYTLFSVAIYLGFTQMMISQENSNVNDIMSGVAAKLKVGSSNLTKETVKNSLTPNYYEIDSTVDNRFLMTERLDTTADALFSKINEIGIVVAVFDPSGAKLYESRPSHVAFEKKAKPEIKEIKINGTRGLSGVTPIMSSQNQNIIGYVQVTNNLTRYHEMSNTVLLAMLLMGFLALVVSGVLGYLLAINFLRPIKQMTQTMNDVRKDTQSDSRMIVPDSNDELSHLTELFNDMLDKMQKYIEQQKQFVEDVSHELRTPVAIMEGHLKLLDRWGKEDPEILEESLTASLQEIERMKSLVQEMLDLSRAEQVDIHYKHELTDVKNIINQVFNNFSMIHPDFVFNLDDDLAGNVMVQIYRNHFEQILIILLDNAVKYSTNRKEIHISVAEDLYDIQIAIQDFGEGIAPEDLQKIFNRFYRIDKARSREKGGNGLGLAIAKELLDGYQGNITVESVLDFGTIFRIRLPIYREKK